MNTNAHLIEKSKELGLSSIPANAVGSELALEILTVLNASPDKLFTAKIMCGIVGVRPQKYFSDTMWGLAQKSLCRHISKRGYYQANLVAKAQVKRVE